MSTILSYVPSGFELRDIQRSILLDVEEAWPNHDIIMLRADVGVGKSLVLQTIARWQASLEATTAIITPRVTLQDQYAKSFPKSPILKGAGRYSCQKKGMENCAECRLVEDDYCETGCPYKKARDRAKGSKYATFNLQSYTYMQDARDILLIDEAHTLFDQLADTATLSLWQHKYGYPSDIHNFETVITWLEGVRRTLNDKEAQLTAYIQEKKAAGEDYADLASDRDEVYTTRDKLYKVYQSARNKDSNLFIEQADDVYRGVMKPLLRIRPKTLTGFNTMLTSARTKRIVLASATLELIDLTKLGLSDKRVKILTYGSPFDVEDQPIIVDPVGNMGYKYQSESIPALATRIKELRAKHIDTKGIVHMPYSMALSLKKHLPEPWLIWHTQDNKEKQLELFKKAQPGTVFIASGMGMGIDLAGPDFGWQAIAKIMYPSKSDKLMEYWYNNDINWITWLTTRELIQTCGRINRYQGDKGVTYVLDSCIGNPNKRLMGLWQSASRLGFLPPHFKKRVTWR